MNGMDYPDTLLVQITPMAIEDLPEVLEIERVAFPSPWSARAYEYELRYNDMAHYFVARLDAAQRHENDRGVMGWLRRLVHGESVKPTPLMVGYAGYWLMAGEAHISTIAVRPEQRRRSFGELMLMHLLDDAARHGAHVATLEVRVSNGAAQQLYLKYGFDKVGLRKAYYSDNNEDAFIMTTPPLNSGQYQEKLRRLHAALNLQLKAQVELKSAFPARSGAKSSPL